MSVIRIPVAETEPAILEPHRNHSAHVVQFYKDDRSLMEELAQLVGNSLEDGRAAIVIGSEAHRTAVARKLKARNPDFARALTEGQYVSLDAAETASRLIVKGMPDPERFEEVIGGIIAQAALTAKIATSPVVIFGEMVALLLRSGNQAAAIRLEELWNDLATKHSFSLRCAYPIADFSDDAEGQGFASICDAHSAVIPEGGLGLHLVEDEGRRAIAKLQQKVEVLQHTKALKESEERFRLLVEAVQDYAIFILDPSGHVTTWNLGAERLKGYQADEIIGRHFSRFYPDADVRAGKPERLLEIATRDGRVEDEGWRVRKDGSRFWADVVITAFKDSSGKIVGFAKVTRDCTERMKTEQALQESQKKLRESEESLRKLSLRLLRSQEQERRRIARDLHDSLGQYLSVLKMKLDFLGKPTAAKDCSTDLAECTELTEEAIKEVRTISYLLYPPMLEELGLRSAIAWYLDGFAKRSGIRTSFEITPEFGRLDSDTELVLFRVLQESLTNIHRHSGSETADVGLLLEGEIAVLRVRDRGKGILPEKFDENLGNSGVAFGVGLRGMSERLLQVGGSLDVRSTAEGTTVTATVPAPRKKSFRVLDFNESTNTHR